MNISGEVKFYFPMELQAAKGICFRYGQDYKLINVISDKGGTYIISHMEIQGEPYVILNRYAPNEEKGQVKLSKDISGHLNGLDIPPGCNFICAGYWNLIFDTRMDSLGGSSKLERKSISAKKYNV